MTTQEKRERAVEGLTALSDSIRRRVEDADDAYGCVSINLKYWQTIEDAISLLKAREPVEPVRRRRHGQIGYSCFCGMCGYGIGRNEKYCALCGRAVKWE